MAEIDFKPFVHRYKKDISHAQRLKDRNGFQSAFNERRKELIKKAREHMFSIRDLTDQAIWLRIITEWIHTRY